MPFGVPWVQKRLFLFLPLEALEKWTVGQAINLAHNTCQIFSKFIALGFKLTCSGADAGIDGSAKSYTDPPEFWQEQGRTNNKVIRCFLPLEKWLVDSWILKKEKEKKLSQHRANSNWR